MNGFLQAVARTGGGAPSAAGSPSSIFVLRNNDLGDLLVITPLFEALRRRFPQTRVVAGVGPWGVPLLQHNPHVDEVIEINAPWHNRFTPGQRLWPALGYLWRSPEIATIAAKQFSVGIDIVGSPLGALLLMRAGVAKRMGTRGYAGGDNGFHETVAYDANEHVGRNALRFAELLGLRDLPENRPQVFLHDEERQAAELRWRMNERGTRQPRLLLGPGSGFAAKAWPAHHWKELTAMLARAGEWNTIIVGGSTEVELATQCAQIGGLANLAGHTSLRDTLALAATADTVVCHSSMLMHAAAAFRVPTLVLLGDWITAAQQHATQWGYPESVLLAHVTPAAVLEALSYRKGDSLAA